MTYTATITKFEKVSGWNDGPCKPSQTVTTGTASTIASAIASAASSSNIGDLAEGETINIIVTAKNN